MQLQQKLQRLLDRSDADSPQVGDELGALLAQYPMEFRTWAVAWISNGGRGRRAHLLLRLLHRKNLLRSLLVNPGAVPLRDAVRVARLAQHAVSNLDGIIAATIRDGTVTQAARALQVLQHVPLTARVVPGLAAALRNPDAKIRSLVSKLLGRLCDDPAAIRALLKDADARVRANTVEGFWGSSHPVARGLMRQCLGDPDNRVAANAALGLHKMGDPDGTEALRALSAHADHRHRISAAWCIAQTADTALLTALEALAEDRIPKVRGAALAALARMRNPTERRGEPDLLVTVSQAYRTPEGGLRLRAFVTDYDDNPVENLSPDGFRVFQDELLLPRGEIRPPAQREPLVTIVWLEAENLIEAVRAKACAAIAEAVQHRGRQDLHCVVASGMPAALAFSSDISQLGAVLNQPGTNAGRSPVTFESLSRALLRAAARPGCRAVVAFSGGAPLAPSLDVERLVQQAAGGETAIHVVVFDMGSGVAAEWPRLAAATQGSYRVVTDEDEVQHAFWWTFSQLSSAYAIGAQGASGPDAEFRLEVRSAGEFGETRFEPLLQHPACAPADGGVSAGAGIPATDRHVK